MSARINIINRIVVDIAVPIQRLWISRLRDNCIRLDEAGESGFVVAGVVVVKTGVAVVHLPGVLAAGQGGGVGAEVAAAPGEVALRADGLRAVVERVARAAEMVYQQVGWRGRADPLRHALPTSVVLFAEGSRTARNFVLLQLALATPHNRTVGALISN